MKEKDVHLFGIVNEWKNYVFQHLLNSNILILLDINVSYDEEQIIPITYKKNSLFDD